MRSTRCLPVVCLVAPFLVLVARADEEKVPLDKLPDPIKTTLKTKFPEAKLLSAEKEKADKETVYEVALEWKGVKQEVTLKEDGSVVSIEKVLAVKDLPKPVGEAVSRKYPGAKIASAEEITKGKDLKDLSYEVVVTTADGKKVEVELDPTGRILKTEDK
jgi:uncharacterized membrane protein YkoI